MIKGAIVGGVVAAVGLLAYEYFVLRTGDAELGQSNRFAVVGAGAVVGAIFLR